MKKKWPLFLGVLLLVIGIIIRKMTDYTYSGVIIILIGVICKIFYITSKFKSGEYKPGYELAILYIGVIVFFTGMYLRSQEISLYPTLLMPIGISLKLVFILMFIKKTRKPNQEPKS